MSTQEQVQANSNDNSSTSSSSSSLVKLDELSSFGATKQARLPALIKLTNSPLVDLNSRDQAPKSASNSMPDFSESQLEKMTAVQQQQTQQSLPANVALTGSDAATTSAAIDKENTSAKPQDVSVDGFQVVDMQHEEEEEDQAVGGPSLPAPDASHTQQQEPAAAASISSATKDLVDESLNAQLLSTDLNTAEYASHLGDSLIEMIINLRNENQNLVRALETNNDYVKERLSEFKRVQEDAKRREHQYAMEKAEHEHQMRKVQRQNAVLSERLKSMEAKLKDMKLEVNETLQAASSSKASSVRGEEILYPELGEGSGESFSNPALLATATAATTMQVDAAECELNNGGHSPSSARPMECCDQQQQQQQGSSGEAQRVAGMNRDELSKRFDASKAQFMALDDPMKQCDQLEQQLNGMGKRDYEICLLQQQLNIYRQDFRLERMAKLEAKIQIEKLKNEIDRLCLERALELKSSDEDEHDHQHDHHHHQADQEDVRARHYGPTPATSAADGLIGKLGHHLGRKAIRSAAKAARYAAKQAHLEERTAAALARAAAAKAAAASHLQSASTQPKTTTSASTPHEPAGEHHNHPAPPHHGHHGHHHHHHHGRRGHRSGGGGGGHRGEHEHHLPQQHHQKPRTERVRGVGSEIVSDLINLGNKTMLTGYKMASTHVNLALDKLSQYEQQQAAQLAADKSRQPTASAPPMDQPSMD